MACKADTSVFVRACVCAHARPCMCACMRPYMSCRAVLRPTALHRTVQDNRQREWTARTSCVFERNDAVAAATTASAATSECLGVAISTAASAAADSLPLMPGCGSELAVAGSPSAVAGSPSAVAGSPSAAAGSLSAVAELASVGSWNPLEVLCSSADSGWEVSTLPPAEPPGAADAVGMPDAGTACSMRCMTLLTSCTTTGCSEMGHCPREPAIAWHGLQPAERRSWAEREIEVDVPPQDTASWGSSCSSFVARVVGERRV